jgi:uncharacterized membrane protein required for colicin V production
MITLFCAFFLFVLLFAVVGALRGPAKEVLVSFSVLVAIAFITLVEELLPLTAGLFDPGSMTEYWFRTLTVIVLVIFGYVTPKISSLSKAAGRQLGIQDYILGFFIGIINGWLIVGTLWFYMDAAGYPFTPYITAPLDAVEGGGTWAIQLINLLPPAIFYGYRVLAAVVIAFVFVIIVMI